jgi:hypothetical protein
MSKSCVSASRRCLPTSSFIPTVNLYEPCAHSSVVSASPVLAHTLIYQATLVVRGERHDLAALLVVRQLIAQPCLKKLEHEWERIGSQLEC